MLLQHYFGAGAMVFYEEKITNLFELEWLMVGGCGASLLMVEVVRMVKTPSAFGSSGSERASTQSVLRFALSSSQSLSLVMAGSPLS